ncbi:hypothetical protein FHX42_000480 [Saccharopolyspora lacisalsi]|uniref:Uncharacterized protein n=1 Tax=Halosaccharopolyspora lacisalsi TaxID=1000566 RepID=A0A839DVE9_9PSEU|nr:hypothetical protein [Halosaccharopolyspora lacisalsi]
MTDSIPWWRRNSNRQRAGYRPPVSWSVDHTAETSGRAKWSTKYSEWPPARRNSPRVGSPAPSGAPSNRFACRWKRVTWASMDR